MWSQLIQRVVRFARWHRRALAALAAAACVFSVVTVFAPPPPIGESVVVAIRTIAAGATINAADVAVKNLPRDSLPADALHASAAAIGKTSIIELGVGAVVTTHAVLGATSPPEGMRYVPIRVPDAELSKLVRVGDRVTVIGVSADGASKILAPSVRVVALPTADGGLLTASDTRGTLLMLEIPDPLVPVVATASLQRALSVVLG